MTAEDGEDLEVDAPVKDDSSKALIDQFHGLEQAFDLPPHIVLPDPESCSSATCLIESPIRHRVPHRWLRTRQTQEVQDHEVLAWYRFSKLKIEVTRLRSTQKARVKL